MQNRQQPPKIDQYGHILSSSGLYVPQTYSKASLRSVVALAESSLNPNGFNEGYRLRRDERTLAVKFPLKGSGDDDRVSDAIIDGRIANVGVSPVIAPQMSGAVRRQGDQAMNATIDITGRETPFRKARNAIAMFDDNPQGVTAALQTMAYRLCTYNRGCPVATVPITFDFDSWEQYGMAARPIVAQGQAESEASTFYLEVDWARFGTPVPFLPDPFDLEATGDTQYPYWYHATRQDKSRVWVLLHSTHIVPVTPGVSSSPLIGTCAAWMCLGYLAEQILIIEERAEKMLYSLADGLIVIGGIDDIDPQTQILDKMEASRKAQFEQGFKAAKGPAIITSPIDQVSIAQITLRNPPGVQFKELREWQEDIIAFCFGETLTAIVTRGGVGYGAQADSASDNTMDMGIGAHLARIANALGSIYPRVQISVTRANDRAARTNVKTFAQFAGGAAQMIDKGVLDAETVRIIIDRDIMTLPEPQDLTASANASDDESDDGSTDENAGTDSADTSSDPQPAAATTQAQPQTGYATVRRMTEAEWSRLHQQRLTADVLSTSDGVTITTEDVDRAISAARRRVDNRLAELLTAEATES